MQVGLRTAGVRHDSSLPEGIADAFDQRRDRQDGRGEDDDISAFHRLAAVRRCDRIIAIEDGAIMEEGTHAELLARPGSVYGKLWRIQAEDSND